MGKGLAFWRFALLKRAHIVVHVKKIPSAEFNVLAVVQRHGALLAVFGEHKAGLCALKQLPVVIVLIKGGSIKG